MLHVVRFIIQTNYQQVKRDTLQNTECYIISVIVFDPIFNFQTLYIFFLIYQTTTYTSYPRVQTR